MGLFRNADACCDPVNFTTFQAQAYGVAAIHEDPGLFSAVAIVRPGSTPAEVEEALSALDFLYYEPALEEEQDEIARVLETRLSVAGADLSEQDLLDLTQDLRRELVRHYFGMPVLAARQKA